MKDRRILFILSIFLLCGLSISAQKNMKGTAFWLTFGKNRVSTDNPYAVANLQIRIVGSELPTTGNIYFTNLGTSIPFSIAAGQVYTYNLSETEKEAVCNAIAGKSNYSVYITSLTPVTVYALDQSYRTTDATNVLPETTLGTDYYQISYTTTSYPDAYIVVATQDSTQIYHNGTLAVTLDRGEVYYRTHYLDMTGDRITANKPIAFFSANQGPQIPYGYDFIDASFQQLAPVNTWGKAFFVPVSWRGRDFVRIVASQNGTNITQTGGTIRNSYGGKMALTNLNVGEWVELEVSLANNGCYIQSNKPVGVCTYLTATRYNDPYDELSDPSQAWLPSLEQKIYSALIAPFIPEGVSNLSEHFALIVTPTATKNRTTMIKISDGIEDSLSGGTWYDHAASKMSFYSMPLTDTTSAYLFTNREGGLIIMGYGTGVAESYYYLSFSAMRTLDAAFYVNDVHYQDLSTEFTCEQPLRFRAEINGDVSPDPGFLKWYINDVEEIAARDKYTWNKILAPGEYQIKIDVMMEGNLVTKTVEATLTIPKDTVIISGDTVICLNNITALTGMPSNGKWKSMNPNIATITSTGLVRGVATGTAEIRYLGCTDSASIIIKVTFPTLDVISTPEICNRENGTITLIVNSEDSAKVLYVWDGLPNTTSSLTGLKAGIYKVSVYDMFCLVEMRDTIEIVHIDGPVANFYLDTNIIKNHDITLTDISKGTIQTWNWDMGDGNEQTGKIVHYKYKDIGYYTIFLEVIDVNGCTDTASKTIYVHDELKVYIPSAFTPNGDGLNDTWKPIMSDYSKNGYQLSIFDRWGQQIFHTTDTEAAWDGTLNGKPVMSNVVYSYHLIVKNIAGKEYRFTGYVTVVR